MKNLVERLNFSTQKPQDGEEYHVFKVDRVSSVQMFDTFCLFCAELGIDLDVIEFNDFDAAVNCFSDYYISKKQEISGEGVESVTCYFWVDEE